MTCNQDKAVPYRNLTEVSKMANLENETCEIVKCVKCLPQVENVCKEIEVPTVHQEIVESCTKARFWTHWKHK